jgi:NAD(P)-dependent dehydrogenase (short-subunit alcohol dehydrogenase family)
MVKRSILITGCSSGIGYCAANGMRQRGWRVIAAARKEDDVARLKGEGFETVHLDYAEPASIAASADKVLELTGGTLFALFNNGGYGQPGAVEDLTTDVLRAQFEANFFGWHDLTRRLLPAMRGRRDGRIVQCSSVLGLISPPYRGAYNASKYALEALSDALRYELHGTGIRVSLIEPGPIESRFTENAAAALQQNIDLANSLHSAKYKKALKRLQGGGVKRFKLGPEAVLKKLIHAVESRSPKARYYVTLPTYMAAIGKRILPQSLNDAIVRHR